MAVYHSRPSAKSLKDIVARSLNRSVLPEIIINHVDEDLGLADDLCESLQRQGWAVVCNRHLPVGRRLDEYLEVALTSARCVVTLWTANSIQSPRVRDVANEALRQGMSVPVLTELVVLPLGHRSVKTVECLFDETIESERFDPVVVAVETVLDGTQWSIVTDDDATNPSLSVRIARRVIESLTKQGADLVPAAQHQRDVFQIGMWLVDAGTNTVTSGDETRKVQPRAMEVLVYLASRAPATVSIEEILDGVWQDRVVVDSAVHRCVRELRVALDDDAKEPIYIETIARRGYRLLAEISLQDQADIS